MPCHTRESMWQRNGFIVATTVFVFAYLLQQEMQKRHNLIDAKVTVHFKPDWSSIDCSSLRFVCVFARWLYAGFMIAYRQIPDVNHSWMIHPLHQFWVATWLAELPFRVSSKLYEVVWVMRSSLTMSVGQHLFKVSHEHHLHRNFHESPFWKETSTSLICWIWNL